MNEKWPIVPFGEILRPNSRPYTLGADEDANLVGMRLYGAGPFHRELKPAMKIAKKSHFVIRAGDVIYNKLFAWKGTFGIVPRELDGMFVSDKFPTYELDRTRVDEDFLRWYFRCPPLWDQARDMSTGSAALSKLTLNPPKFLLLTIPLPSLLEQRRIVERIETFAAKIDEACNLRHQANSEADKLFFAGCDSALIDAEKEFPSLELNHLVIQERGISYGVVQTGNDVEGGVPTLRAGDLQWFACKTHGVKRVAPEVERTYRRTRLRGEELLLRIRGGVGAVALCPKELIGGNVSREIAVIPLTDRVDPRYAMFLLASPTNQQRMAGNVKGTSYVGINLKDVRTLKLPLPPLTTQHSVVKNLEALRHEVENLRRLGADSKIELNAILPSILDRAFKGEL